MPYITGPEYREMHELDEGGPLTVHMYAMLETRAGAAGQAQEKEVSSDAEYEERDAIDVVDPVAE